MSLDVYLESPHTGELKSRIFIREDGGTKEISREEWDQRYPGKEPVTFLSDDSGTVYTANITHNLSTMAEEAGIYRALWRPEEMGVTVARQLIEPLTNGLTLLKSDRSRFEVFNPSNGWGTYEGLVKFVAQYLEACREYQDATVRVSR